MNILIATGPYPPEIRSISIMMRELAEELYRRGHDTTVIACWPRCNLSEEARKRKYDAFSIEKGVRVIRVKTPPNHGVNYILRGVAQVVSPYLFLRKVKKYLKQEIDAVLVYSPPLPYAMLGTWIKDIYKAKYVLNIQDIFPQNAIDLGVLKNRLLIRYFEGMERRAYDSADIITSHTSSSKKFLIERRRIAEGKISVVPNWIDIEDRESHVAPKKFREEYHLQGKFIFLFAGILGPSQNLDYIIQIAEKVADIPDICFLLVGDGMEKTRLERVVREKELKNVLFRPFVSSEHYPYLVQAADVGLVCLSSKNKTPAIPGKILGYMAGSIPVVAFLNQENDAHALIDEAQCGFSMVSCDVEEGAKLARAIYRNQDQRKQYGENGFRHVMAHYSKKVCIDKIEELIYE